MEVLSSALPLHGCSFDSLSKALPGCVTTDRAMPMRGKKTVRSGLFVRSIHNWQVPQEMIPPILCGALRAIFPLIPPYNFICKETP